MKHAESDGKAFRFFRSERLMRIGYALLLCVVFSMGQSGCKKPETQVGTIVGDSMAPTILGKHLAVECGDCQFVFQCNLADEAPNRRTIVCPNCGHGKLANLSADDADVPNSHSFITRSAEEVIVVDNLTPERWCIVALRLPNNSDMANDPSENDPSDKARIKRVVGLANETIEFVFGDLFLNDRILRKPWAIQKQMRIPVHDSSFASRKSLGSRWRDHLSDDGGKKQNSKESGSVVDSSSETFNDLNNDLNKLFWKRYHHWRCFAGMTKLEMDFPIEDSYGFNQGLARNLNLTDDLFVELTVNRMDAGIVGWRFKEGELCHEFRFDLSARELVYAVPGLVAAEIRPVESPAFDEQSPEQFGIEFSSFDMELVVVIGGTECFRKELTGEPGGLVAKYPLSVGTSAPFAIGGSVITRIQIWRDIYYFGKSAEQDRIHGGAGMIVLGDNVPVSEDSRFWAEAGISEQSVIGVVELEPHGQMRIQR